MVHQSLQLQLVLQGALLFCACAGDPGWLGRNSDRNRDDAHEKREVFQFGVSEVTGRPNAADMAVCLT